MACDAKQAVLFESCLRQWETLASCPVGNQAEQTTRLAGLDDVPCVAQCMLFMRLHCNTSIRLTTPCMFRRYALQLYVIGPSCVLTRRSTLTPDILEAATAAAPAGRAGVVILPRLSADKWVAVQAAQQQPQQQALNDVAPAANSASSSSSNVDGGGAAIADASVADDPAAPPLWAMQQLAAHLRAALGLNLFNVDIIAPSEGLQASGEGGCCAAGLAVNGRYESCIGVDGGQGPQQAAAQLDERQQQLLVVDINYFPGYDKVPGAELLFAQFLAQCTR